MLPQQETFKFLGYYVSGIVGYYSTVNLLLAIFYMHSKKTNG